MQDNNKNNHDNTNKSKNIKTLYVHPFPAPSSISCGALIILTSFLVPQINGDVCIAAERRRMNDTK